jgi:hypothetical protein
MPKTARTNTSRDKVQAHRSRLRARGLRPIQIWVPDVRSSAFRSQAHAQSLAVSHSPEARDDQGFIDAVSDLDQP